VTLVLLVRHGLTAGTGTVLTGRTPGIPLDDRGRAQAGALAARLADVPLDAIITSPLDRCRETAEAIAAARDGSPPPVQEDEQFAEVKYGDWTGQPLKRLAKEPLWRVVQTHPSAVRFPGKDAESMPEVQHRAVNAVREWNARLGKDAVYLICSHGDVLKAIIADCLGMHLDLSQRIQVDPCSLSVIRYTPLRPFLVRMNDTGRTAAGLARPHDAGAEKAAANGGAPQQAAAEAASRPTFAEGDAAIGGGAGG
jgi:probable phosphomutase (TIGR03848 family)